MNNPRKWQFNCETFFFFFYGLTLLVKEVRPKRWNKLLKWYAAKVMGTSSLLMTPSSLLMMLRNKQNDQIYAKTEDKKVLSQGDVNSSSGMDEN